MTNTFLLSPTDQVRCVNDPERALTEFTVAGRWDGELRKQTSRALRACVEETPRAVLADVARLDDPAGESAPTWQTASRYAEQGRKPTGVIVCAAAPALQARLLAEDGDGGCRVSVADSVSAARLILGQPPSWNGRQRHQLTLPPQLDAPAAARMMAGDACMAFNLTDLLHPVRLIVSELAANAVLHACTDFDVQVSVRESVLHVGVRDRNPRLPGFSDTTAPGVGLAAPGNGLRVVAAAATAWGALPCPDGKIVWATLAIGGQK